MSFHYIIQISIYMNKQLKKDLNSDEKNENDGPFTVEHYFRIIQRNKRKNVLKKLQRQRRKKLLQITAEDSSDLNGG